LGLSLGRQAVSLVTMSIAAIHHGSAGPADLLRLFITLMGVTFTLYFATRMFRRGVTLVRGLRKLSAE
jgi:hypothetical protein